MVPRRRLVAGGGQQWWPPTTDQYRQSTTSAASVWRNLYAFGQPGRSTHGVEAPFSRASRPRRLAVDRYAAVICCRSSSPRWRCPRSELRLATVMRPGFARKYQRYIWIIYIMIFSKYHGIFMQKYHDIYQRKYQVVILCYLFTFILYFSNFTLTITSTQSYTIVYCDWKIVVNLIQWYW